MGLYWRCAGVGVVFAAGAVMDPLSTLSDSDLLTERNRLAQKRTDLQRDITAIEARLVEIHEERRARANAGKGKSDDVSQCL